jgi:hypothetical protein
MLKLFIALNILLLNLYACKGGFDSCKQKIIDSNSINNQQLQIIVNKNQRLIFSKTKPRAKILKYDKFLHLYLVEDKKGFKYPFRINNKLTLGTAAVDKKIVLEGKILKHQIGLNKLARYNQPLFVPSILLNSCCALEGIVTPEGIIEKEYIDRFLKIKKVEYSDIGIRVKDEKKLVIVNASNPFMDNNPFKVDDCILEFDSKKVRNASELMRWILFSKIGSKHKVKIKRAGKILTVYVISQKRNGGGYVSDTFLEFLGLSFDKTLHVTKIAKKAEKYQLVIGDQLIQINEEEIKTKQDILEKLANSKESTYLLFQRRHFQFFIRVN